MNSSTAGFHHFTRIFLFKPTLALAGLLLMTDATAAELPATCQPLPDGISAWFPAETTRNTMGGAPGSLIGDARISPGFRGSAFEFDGVNDVVRVPGGPGLDLQDFTVHGWIRRQSTQRVGADGAAVFMGGGAGAWALVINAEGALYLGKVGTANSAAHGAIRDDQWHHVAASRRGTTVQFYVDGVSVGESTLAELFLPSNTYGIGGLGVPFDNINYSFQGWIDEMTVHREALSSAAIMDLADPQAPPWCREDLELIVLSSPNRVPRDGDYLIQAEVRNWNGEVAEGVQMTVDLPDGSGVLRIEPSQGTISTNSGSLRWELGAVPSGGAATLSLQLRASIGGAGWVTQRLSLAPHPADQIAANSEAEVRFLITGDCLLMVESLDGFWRAEENADDLVTGRAGTVLGRVDFVPGVVGSAYAFRENLSAIQVPQPEVLRTSDFTVDCWIRRESLAAVSPSGNHSFFVGGPLGALGFGLVPDGRLYLHRIPTESIFSGRTVSDTNWHHVAVTRAGTDIRFYIDGLSAGTATYAGVFEPGGHVSIGGLVGIDAGNTYSFLGDLDELAMYSHALSPDRISEIAFAGSTGRCLNDVRLRVESIPERVVVGDPFELVFRADQIGTQTAEGVRFLMVLPPGLEFLSGTSELGTIVETAGVVRSELGQLQPGSRATLRIRLRAGVARDYRFEARAEGLTTDVSEVNNVVALRILTGEFHIAVGTATIQEGSAGVSNRMEFPVQFSIARGEPVRLAFTVEGLSAAAETDFVEASGEITVPPGVTNIVLGVTILGDGRFERNEELRMQVRNLSPEPLRSTEAIGVIQNDDPAPSLRVDPPSWSEGPSGSHEEFFDVQLVGTSDLPVLFRYRLESLGAQLGSDFATGEGLVEIPPGGTRARIPVTLFGDGTAEGDELLLLRILDPQDCLVPADRIRGRIADDDAPGVAAAGFRVEIPPGPVEPGRPFEATVTALDDHGGVFPGFDGTVRLTARHGSGIPSSVVVSEVAADTPESNDFVELLNVGPQPADLAGWQLRIYGPATWPEPTVIMTLSGRMTLQPGQAGVFNRFFDPGNEFASVANPARIHPWNGLLGSELFGEPLVAVVLVDSGGRVEDALLAGRARREFIEFDLGPTGTRWGGDPVPTPVSTGYRLQRGGDRNTRSAADWVGTAESTPRVPGPSLGLPFLDAIPLPVAPGALTGFSAGVWRGMVTLPEPVSGAVLAVDDGNGHLGSSRPVDSQSDLDSDGLPDVWEILHGFSFRDPEDARSDLDRDGFTALEEWTAGTSPRDASSALVLQLAGDRLRWTAAPGRRYRLEQRNRLPGAGWELLRVHEPDAGGQDFEVIAEDPPAAERWFRLLVELP